VTLKKHNERRAIHYKETRRKRQNLSGNTFRKSKNEKILNTNFFVFLLRKKKTKKFYDVLCEIYVAPL
jgi:hypothetical protein